MNVCVCARVCVRWNSSVEALDRNTAIHARDVTRHFWVMTLWTTHYRERLLSAGSVVTLMGLWDRCGTELDLRSKGKVQSSVKNSND